MSLMISREHALDTTIKELHTYAEKPNEYRLTLCKMGDETIVCAVARENLSFFDKFKAFFGVSNFNLTKVISYLSNDFRSLLSEADLTQIEIEDITKACHALQPGVKKHNDRLWFTRTTISDIWENNITSLLAKKGQDKLAQLAPFTTLVSTGNFEGALSLLKKEKRDSKFEDKAIILTDAVIASLEKELAKAFKEGRVPIKEGGEYDFAAVCPRCNSFLDELSTLVPIQEKREILHLRAAIHKEINRLEKKLADKPDFAIQKKLESYCRHHKKEYPATEEIFNAQKKALEELLKNKGKLDMQQAKQNALFNLVGMTSKKDQEKVFAAQKIWQTLQNQAKTQIDSLIVEVENAGLHPLARNKLIADIRESSDEIVLDCLDKPTSLNDTFAMLKEGISLQIGFYQKWKKALKSEMIQGFGDSGEALGRGVCFALSMRWAIAELKKSSLHDFQDVMHEIEMGKILPQDRHMQAWYRTGLGDHPVEILNIVKRLGGKNYSEKVLGKNLKGVEDIKACLMKFCTGNDFLTNNGVGELSFSWKGHGHAIAICFQHNQEDPANSVYRISDPNFGSFTFSPMPPTYDRGPVEKQFFACLTGLITTMYDTEIDALRCLCFEV
jgi:hypothetical protein